MDDITAEEVLTAVFVCLGVAGGAFYGWAAVGTFWATVGGAVMIGLFALLLATLVAFAVDAIAHLFRRSNDR